MSKRGRLFAASGTGAEGAACWRWRGRQSDGGGVLIRHDKTKYRAWGLRGAQIPGSDKPCATHEAWQLVSRLRDGPAGCHFIRHLYFTLGVGSLVWIRGLVLTFIYAPHAGSFPLSCLPLTC